MDSYNDIAHYAVLIGIDAYPIAPLRSCVQDVQDFELLLEKLPFHTQIQTFTAPNNQVNTGDPAEYQTLRLQWPTYENVKQAFERVVSSAKAGDSVYIHFSGHGTRVEASNKFSNSSMGDLALILLEDLGSNEVYYLEGLTLATILNGMVAKGLWVVLVLDCCFAGSVLRDDNVQVRCFAATRSNALEESQRRLRGLESYMVHRNASMMPNWLINPNGYAILTACGPHEITTEVKTVSDRRNGALTRCLIEVMGTIDTLLLRCKELYEHLCAIFQEHCPRQTPMFYGNKYNSFFHSIHSELTTPLLTATRMDDGSFLLQLGRAHGVVGGDTFALSGIGAKAANREKDNNLVSGMIVAKVIKAGSFSSTLMIVDPAAPDATRRWTARMLNQAQLYRCTIRVDSAITKFEALQRALEMKSLDSKTFQKGGTERPIACDLSIRVGDDHLYVIENKDSRNRITLPPMLFDKTPLNVVANVLEHLARYELVKNIANKQPFGRPSSSRQAKVHILDLSGQAYPQDTIISVKQNNETRYDLELVITNEGSEPIYIFILNLGPLWQVENILRGNHDICPPSLPSQGYSGIWRKKLKMMIPEDLIRQGVQQCDDLVKVFITSRFTSFSFLELPKLIETFEGERKKILNNSIDNGTQNGAMREGSGHIEMLQNDELADWVALNFHIRTFLGRDARQTGN